MKRFLSILIMLSMIISITSCSNNNKQQNTDKSTQEINIGSVSDKSTSSESNLNNQEQTNKIVMSSANERLKYIIRSLRTDEENDVYEIDITNEKGFLDLVGITEENVEEYAISASLMNVQAYTIAIVKPVEGKEEDVKNALITYRDSVIKSFKQYLPDQLAKAENSYLLEDLNRLGYYVLVMCDNQDQLYEQLLNKLENIEDIGVDESLPPQIKDKMLFTEIYNINDAYKISKENGDKIYNFEYFNSYENEDISNGVVILKLDLGLSYYLLVGFKDTKAESIPEYIQLVSKEDDTKTDIRENNDLDGYLNRVIE